VWFSDKKGNKKAVVSAPQPINEQGTERDLAAVCRRTPRRQNANGFGEGVENGVEHQECAPFFGFFVL